MKPRSATIGMRGVSVLAICAAMGVTWAASTLARSPAGDGPSPLKVSSDPGAERAAGGAVMVVQQICIPLVPELSHYEEQTSAVLAGELRAAGYAVADHIGVYPDASRAFGVVGILKNGPGR